MTATLEDRLREFEDHQEIVRLKARYCDYCDRDRPSRHEDAFGPDAIATLFVENGVWDARPNGPYAVGRTAIRESFIARRTTQMITSHSVTNPIIRINGDLATGQWNAILYASIAGKSDSLAFGIYDEEYIRTPEGWRFQSLVLRITGVLGQHGEFAF